MSRLLGNKNELYNKYKEAMDKAAESYNELSDQLNDDQKNLLDEAIERAVKLEKIKIYQNIDRILTVF